MAGKIARVSSDRPDSPLIKAIQGYLARTNESATSLSKKISPNNPTIIRQMLEGRSKNPRGDTLSNLARELGTTVDALMGRPVGGLFEPVTAPLFPEDAPSPQPIGDDDAGEPRPGYLILREFDVAAAAGPGSIPVLTGDGTAHILAEWRVPRALLPAQYQGGNIAIIRVQGDSMVPELMPEERVMVDLAQTFIGPEGIYLVVIGDSLLVKRVQIMPGRQLRLVSKNPEFQPVLMPADEVRVLGRVIGRWEWK